MIERFQTLSVDHPQSKLKGTNGRKKISYQFEDQTPKISVIFPEGQNLNFLSPPQDYSPFNSQPSTCSELPACDRPKVLRNLQLKLEVVAIASQLSRLQKKQLLNRRQDKANKQNCEYLARNDRGQLLRNHNELKRIRIEEAELQNTLKYDCQQEVLVDKENELVQLQRQLEQLRSEKQAIIGQCDIQKSSLNEHPVGRVQQLSRVQQHELEKLRKELNSEKLLTTRLRREIMHRAVSKDCSSKAAMNRTNRIQPVQDTTKTVPSSISKRNFKPQETAIKSISAPESRVTLDEQIRKLKQEEEVKLQRLSQKEGELFELLLRIRHLKDSLKTEHEYLQSKPLPAIRKKFASGM